MKYTIIALQPGEDWKGEALLRWSQSNLCFSFHSDADDFHNGFVFYHMPCLLYIIMWEAIFPPDIFSVIWCFVWADGVYSFTSTKVVIYADDYRKWFKWIDLTGRITCKMFWHVHVLTLCLDSIFSEACTKFSTQKDLTWSCPSEFFWQVLHSSSFFCRSGNRNLLKMAF